MCVERAYTIASTHGLRAHWYLYPISWIAAGILPFDTSLQQLTLTRVGRRSERETEIEISTVLILCANYICVKTRCLWSQTGLHQRNQTVLQLNAIYSSGCTITKVIVHTKMQIYNLLTGMLFQTCMHFILYFFLLKSKIWELWKKKNMTHKWVQHLLKRFKSFSLHNMCVFHVSKCT